VKPFVTAVVTIGDTPVQLMGLLEGETGDVKIGAPVTGRIVRNPDVNKGRSSFRWQIRG
jgi:uncharacterized OB-fold protein